MRSVASVTTPSWPSEPQITPRRSRPAASRWAPPISTTVPSISTMRHAEQVVGGDPVLQAVGAAGVHRDVAGDGAGELARRVGGVEEILVLDRRRDAEVGAAGLHPDEAVLGIDLEDLVQPRDARAARSPPWAAPRRRGCPRAARHHRDALGVADAQDGGDLLGGGGQHHRQRRAAVGGEARRIRRRASRPGRRSRSPAAGPREAAPRWRPCGPGSRGWGRACPWAALLVTYPRLRPRAPRWQVDGAVT